MIPDDGGGYFALDDGAADDLGDGGMVFGDGGAAAAAGSGDEAADGHGSLCDGVNLVVRAEQRRLQQHAALESLGVAHGRNLHVQAGARFDEGGDVRGHHDDGDVFGGEGGGGHRHSVTLEHVGDRLLGVSGVLVAFARETGDHAKAHELVVPGAGDHGEVAQADSTGAGARNGQEQNEKDGAGAGKELPDARAHRFCSGVHAIAGGVIGGRRRRVQDPALGIPQGPWFQIAWNEWHGSERIEFVPDAVKPPFVRAVGDRAAGDDVDAGVGDVITVNGVVGGDVVEADDAPENHRLMLSAEGRLAPAFNHHVSIGQHVNDARGDVGDDRHVSELEGGVLPGVGLAADDGHGGSALHGESEEDHERERAAD